MAPRVWLITGCSSGIGQDLALEVLSRGDKVIATARPRSIAELDVLKSAGADVLELDVTSPPDKIKDTASVAHGIYGRIDVLVNNAGYAILAAAEENSFVYPISPSIAWNSDKPAPRIPFNNSTPTSSELLP